MKYKRFLWFVFNLMLQTFIKPKINQVKTILIVTILFLNLTSICQTGNKSEQNYLNMRSYVIGIGTVIIDSIYQNNKKVAIKRFETIGSGLITYVKHDTTALTIIVTARHVINFFTEKKIKSIFLRPSWADTIKTTDYFGVEIPIINSDNTPNTFLYPDIKVDLGCILMLPKYTNMVYYEKLISGSNRLLPYSAMTTSYLGDQVWIGGYPGHINSNIQNRFFYSIATFKPGYIAWKPSSNMKNTDLNHITLVESNATYGNSGGPVFALHSNIELVGILVAGYDDVDPVYSDNKPVFDPVTKKALIAKSRSGVSIIEKAEFVKKLIEYVQKQITTYRIYKPK